MKIGATDSAMRNVNNGVLGCCHHWFRDRAKLDVLRPHPLGCFHCLMWMWLVFGRVYGTGHISKVTREVLELTIELLP